MHLLLPSMSAHLRSCQTSRYDHQPCNAGPSSIVLPGDEPASDCSDVHPQRPFIPACPCPRHQHAPRCLQRSLQTRQIPPLRSVTCRCARVSAMIHTWQQPHGTGHGCAATAAPNMRRHCRRPSQQAKHTQRATWPAPAATRNPSGDQTVVRAVPLQSKRSTTKTRCTTSSSACAHGGARPAARAEAANAGASVLPRPHRHSCSFVQLRPVPAPRTGSACLPTRLQPVGVLGRRGGLGGRVMRSRRPWRARAAAPRGSPRPCSSPRAAPAARTWRGWRPTRRGWPSPWRCRCARGAR